jgi:hypothetical protein
MMLINPFMVASSSAVTQILMPLTTADGFVDIKNNHAITVVGSPTISTVQSKFGAGALLVSNGNYLRIASTPTLNMSGNAPFTFECWLYIISDAGGYYGDGILSMRTSSVYCPLVIKTASTYIGNSELNGWNYLAGTGVTTGVWTHYALVGDGTNIKAYIDGVLTGGTHAHPSWPSTNNFLNIGFDADGYSNAYINDVRVSSGVAYSGNFTPPSSPFTV